MRVFLATLCMFCMLVSPVNAAQYENSPAKGYYVYAVGDKVALFEKPNGKKTITLKSYEETADGPAHLSMTVVQFVKNQYWVQVEAISVKGKKYTGYVRTTAISPNFVSADYAFVNVTEGLNLRAKPTTQAKIVARIPYGTLLTWEYEEKLPSDSSWLAVSYVVKGKKYSGYVAKKYVTYSR